MGQELWEQSVLVRLGMAHHQAGSVMNSTMEGGAMERGRFLKLTMVMAGPLSLEECTASKTPAISRPAFGSGHTTWVCPQGKEPTTEQDWRKVQPPPRVEVRPPKGAPNVVIVLMDQSCYADPSGMGGRQHAHLRPAGRGGLKYVNSTSIRCVHLHERLC